MTTYAPWHERILVAFDCESTGTDPDRDRIVTAAVTTIDPATRTVTTHEWLANPGLPIPQAATDVHGVTTDYAVQHGQDAGDVAAHLALTLGEAWMHARPVIVYNAAYDLTLLDRELRRHRGVGIDTGSVVDPMVIDKQYDRYRKGSRKLTAVAEHYGITLSAQDAHGAAADTLAAARLAWKLAHVYPDLANMRLPELHMRQIDWRAEQQQGLAEYFRKQGKHQDADGVRGDWPVIPATGVAVSA